MASWLQNQPVSFVPYTPKYSAELYGQIGMMKQAQYNEGVQQIQGTLDAVGSLPVGNAADKAYLETKMSAAVSKANEMAAADYSDQNIVGRLRMMAVGVAKDNVVQTAMASASQYKKEVEAMETARKEGKSAVNNERDFAERSAKWLNSKEAGTVFNERYHAYTDYRKKLTDGITKLVASSDISDDAWTVDAAGNRVLTDAVIREKIGGLSLNRIKGFVSASLDSNDLYQMSIDGVYAYDNKTPEEFAAIITADHQNNIDFLDKEIKRLTDKQSGLAAGDARNELQAEIDTLTKEKGTVIKDNQTYADMIKSGNDRQAKANFYTSQFIRNFSYPFAYKDNSSTYEVNPIVNVQLKRAEMNAEAERFAFKYAQEEDHFRLNYNLKLREVEGKEKEGDAGYGRVNETIPQNELPDISMAGFQENTGKMEADLQAEEADFLASEGVPGDKNWLATQELQYESDPMSVTASIRHHFRHTAPIRDQIATNKQLMIELGKKADAQEGLTLKNIIPEGMPGVDFSVNGKNYHYAASDIVDINNKIRTVEGQALRSVPTGKNTMGTFFGVSTDKGGQNERAAVTNALKKFAASASEGERAIINAYIKKNYEGGDLNSTEQGINSRLHQVSVTVNQKEREVMKARNAYFSEEIAKRTGESQRATYTLPAGKAEQRIAIRDRVQSLLKRNMFEDGVDVEKLGELNIDDDASYSITIKGRTSYGEPKYWMTVGKGADTDNVVRFKLSPEDKRALMGDKFETTSDYSPEVERMRLTQNGTTNFAGVSDPIKASVNPYYKSHDFPSVKNFSVKGDIFQRNGLYGIMLYVYNPLSGKLEKVQFAPPIGLMSDITSVNLAVSQLGDDAIYELMTGEELTPEILQEIKEINKRPK